MKFPLLAENWLPLKKSSFGRMSFFLPLLFLLFCLYSKLSYDMVVWVPCGDCEQRVWRFKEKAFAKRGIHCKFRMVRSETPRIFGEHSQWFSVVEIDASSFKTLQAGDHKDENTDLLCQINVHK